MPSIRDVVNSAMPSGDRIDNTAILGSAIAHMRASAHVAQVAGRRTAARRLGKGGVKMMSILSSRVRLGLIGVAAVVAAAFMAGVPWGP